MYSKVGHWLFFIRGHCKAVQGLQMKRPDPHHFACSGTPSVELAALPYFINGEMCCGVTEVK